MDHMCIFLLSGQAYRTALVQTNPNKSLQVLCPYDLLSILELKRFFHPEQGEHWVKTPETRSSLERETQQVGKPIPPKGFAG